MPGCARLTTKSQLIALLYGQLSGAASLREIVAGLGEPCGAALSCGRGAGVGARPWRMPTRSARPRCSPSCWRCMMEQAHRGLRRKLAETTYLIDSTGVRLNERSAGWARFSAGVCGAKVHVIYDPDADRPIYAAITAANVNDITAAKADADRAGRHLCLRSRLLRLCAGGPSSTQPAAASSPGFKTNTPLDMVEELPVAGRRQHPVRPHRLPAGAPGQQPQATRCRTRCARSRVTTETGKVLRILSNDLDASAAGDRRSLQAPLGDRAVLPLGQADPEDHAASSAPPRTPCASRSPSR